MSMRCASSHGAISSYAQARIPAYPSGWKNAPKTSYIGFSRRSSLCGRYSCRCGADFTYFRTTVSLPSNFNLTRFDIELNGMDDGTRVTIINSRYPNGITPPGAYVYLGGRLTQNLRAYAKVGEVNVIILTHIDDCCSESNLRSGYIRVNGKRLPVCSPSQEVCDGKDNDCDGQIDEALNRPCKTACGSGTEYCSSGRWVNCTAKKPVAEKCNGKDDDCDGKVDENWSNLGADCRAGTGLCQRNGTFVCNGAQTGVRCNAVPGAPGPELCDGKDNDCDGKVDEDWSKKGSACSVGQGVCQRSGTYVCDVSQKSTRCSAKAGSPSTEICDGKDNDCDGQTDEGLKRTCKTVCGSGQETCAAGRWVNCTAQKPFQEICDGKDNDCDGKVDENWVTLGKPCAVGIGSCSRPGKLVCNSSKTNVQCDATAGPPSRERCDGKDNDCDGQIDEGFTDLGKACVAGVGVCKQTGKKVCKQDGSGTTCSVLGRAPSPELCNGLDDDCNGTVDEGLVRPCKSDCGTGTQTCVSGKWAACNAPAPKKETCNNLDDDCDGIVDEGLQRECKTICGVGKATCIQGSWKNCTAQTPKKEECNGLDDDCDGKTDEDLAPRKCSSDCGQGTAVCQSGKWSGCSGPAPQPEVCDGKDNDCDGIIDEGLLKSCSTDCGKGFLYCRNAKWTTCSAPKPRQEVCDSKDNDCDGTIDNNAICPKGQRCERGACRLLCRNGECPKGSQCKAGICEGDLCKKKQCPTGKLCSAGQCVSPCDLVQCKSGNVCSNGVCVKDDCFVKGCPDKNDVCKEGKCVKDPCDGITCADGEYCREGKCFRSCAEVRCKEDELCKAGKCIQDPGKTGACKNVTCQKDELCVQGKCLKDPCIGVQCPKGRICKDGNCVGDPCLAVQCPGGQICKEGDCTKSVKPDGNQQEGSGDTDGGADKEGDDKGEASTVPENSSTTDKEERNDGSRKEDLVRDRSTGTQGTDEPPSSPGASPGCGCTAAPSLPNLSLWLLLMLFVIARVRRKS